MTDERFATAPSNRWFGFRLLQRSRERAEVELPVRADFVQEEGVVHGGVITALADTTAVWLLWPDLQDGAGMTGVEFKMNFLAADVFLGDMAEQRLRLAGEEPERFSVCGLTLSNAEEGKLIWDAWLGVDSGAGPRDAAVRRYLLWDFLFLLGYALILLSFTSRELAPRMADRPRLLSALLLAPLLAATFDIIENLGALGASPTGWSGWSWRTEARRMSTSCRSAGCT